VLSESRIAPCATLRVGSSHARARAGVAAVAAVGLQAGFKFNGGFHGFDGGFHGFHCRIHDLRLRRFGRRLRRDEWIVRLRARLSCR